MTVVTVQQAQMLLASSHPDAGAQWIENQTDDAYHSDKSAVSASSLSKILRSPATFKETFWGPPRPASDALKLGRLVHMALLEPSRFVESYVVMPVFEGFTKDGRLSNQSGEAKAKKASWFASLPPGTTVVTEEERDVIEGIANSVMAHRDAKDILTGGKTEVSGYYVDQDSGIRCKIRPDFIHFGIHAEVDLKTTQDCSRYAFSRSIMNYNYHFQRAMYAEGIKAITGKYPEHSVFIAVEKEPPFEVAVYRADIGMMDYGREQYKQALRTLRTCIDTMTWPGIQATMEDIALPAYVFNQGDRT